MPWYNHTRFSTAQTERHNFNVGYTYARYITTGLFCDSKPRYSDRVPLTTVLSHSSPLTHATQLYLNVPLVTCLKCYLLLYSGDEAAISSIAVMK